MASQSKADSEDVGRSIERYKREGEMSICHSRMLGQEHLSNQSFLEYGGLYLLPEKIQCDLNISRICAYGRVTNSTPGYITFLAYTEDTGSYNRAKFQKKIVVNMQNHPNGRCIDLSLEIEQNQLFKGEKLAVFIPSECNRSNGKEQCPLQVNFESKHLNTLFFYNGSNISNQKLNKSEFSMQVQQDLNIQIVFNSSESMVAKIIIVVLIIVIVCISLAFVVATVFVWRMKKKPNDMKGSLTMNNTEDHEMNQEYLSNLRSRNTSNSNRKNHQISVLDNGYDKLIDVPNDQATNRHLSISSHYEIDMALYKSIIGDDEDHDYEEPYFEPATKKEELMLQLKKLSILEIPRENIEIQEYLGNGQFGVVSKGVWRHEEDGSHQPVTEEVAVKSMESGVSEEEKIMFLQEAAIMGQFNHPNIVRILGIINNDQPWIVVDLMQRGDLRRYLSTLKPESVNAVSNELGPTLLSYSRQIAFGMMYLSIKSFVHRDLAARNVLVSNDGICKIADFGLSRDLQKEDYYVSHGGKVPVKWTAPEALHFRKYSTASDVWSYGCLLYEIWSLGEKPFHIVTNGQAITMVASGYRLPPPPGCPMSIYDLMIKCWHPDVGNRPSFLGIVVQLQKPDFEILKWSQQDLQTYHEESRTLGGSLEKGYSLYVDLQRTYCIDEVDAENETDKGLDLNLSVSKNYKPILSCLTKVMVLEKQLHSYSK